VTHEQLEEGAELLLDFDKLKKVSESAHPVIPAAVQDIDSGDVLIIGYVSREALDYALEHNVATFWSTSRDELWIKGKTSGDALELPSLHRPAQRCRLVPHQRGQRKNSPQLLLPPYRQRQAGTGEVRQIADKRQTRTDLEGADEA
jgi:phosphoribosyl-AMP cyclohydrolase